MEVWNDYINAQDILNAEIKSEIASIKSTHRFKSNGLNISYKVESKEIPRLPKDKVLQGKSLTIGMHFLCQNEPGKN